MGGKVSLARERPEAQETGAQAPFAATPSGWPFGMTLFHGASVSVIFCERAVQQGDGSQIGRRSGTTDRHSRSLIVRSGGRCGAFCLPVQGGLRAWLAGNAGGLMLAGQVWL